MYKNIYQAYCNLTKGDQAELKRSNLKNMANTPAYFRVQKFSGCVDNAQTLRVLYLLVGLDISQDSESALSVADALQKAGVKEQAIIQISRSGTNGIEYLKRQLIRCEHLSLNSVGTLAQYWGDNARRNLLKNFILADNQES